MKKSISFLLLVLFVFNFCSGQQQLHKKKAMQKMETTPVKPLDTAMIEKITGMKGKVNKGQYKITVPQNDLNVSVDGFKIIPAMGLGSWIAFTPSPGGAMIMGDIILTESDLGPFEQEVIHQGLTISAIHNHFIRSHPNVLFMHIAGMGKTEDIAQKVKAVFDKVTELRGKNPASEPADSVENTIDTKDLDAIIGYKGEMSKGVYKYTIGRPDVDLKEHGLPVSSFGGFNTWAVWQGTEDKAAVAGDFTMLENEVEPVVKALIENGIEVIALHNHMIHEQPRIFFLHYWGIGPVQKLAKGLKEALDKTGRSLK